MSDYGRDTKKKKKELKAAMKCDSMIQKASLVWESDRKHWKSRLLKKVEKEIRARESWRRQSRVGPT